MPKIMILVHGLGGTSDGTWGKFPEFLEKDTDVDFSVVSYGYESPHLLKQFWKRAPSILNIANGLLTDIEARCDLYNDEIILAGHSLGGLVIKKLLLRLKDKKINHNIKKVCFFDVPHDGSGFANVGKFISFRNYHLKSLCRDSSQLDELSEQWVDSELSNGFDIISIIAANDDIVSSSSAKNIYRDKKIETINNVNHSTIVKPENTESSSYIVFKKFILEKSTVSQLKNDIAEIGGIYKYFNKRTDINDNIWDYRYRESESRIYLLGHSIDKPFSDEIIIKWIGDRLDNPRSLKIEVVLLNPYYEKLHGIIRAQTGGKLNKDLKNHIFNTISNIKKRKQNISDDERRAGEKSFLQVRVTDRIIYNSINIFDNEGIITLYSSKDKIGDESPTFFIRSLQMNKNNMSAKKSTLDFYESEFKRFWQSGRHPEELIRLNSFNLNKRVFKYRPQINEIEQWMKDRRQKLPEPRFIAIHLTNKCTGNKGRRICSNCFFSNSVGGNYKEIETDDVLNIINDAVGFGVYNFEFSGGGEPLEHSGIKKIISELNAIRNDNKNIKCGLLTNGLFLTDDLIENIFETNLFSYVKFNYCESIYRDDKMYNQFQMTLKKVIKKKIESGTSTRIGVKALLKKGGRIELLNNILKIKNDLGNLFKNLSHLTIKPLIGRDNTPDKKECNEFKNFFYDYLYSYPDDWGQRDIQTELEFYNINKDFKCRLNPLRAVIDPNANLMICPNYQNKYEELTIGNLKRDTVKLNNLWGGEDHHKKATLIDVDKVCYTGRYCTCRFVKYDEILKQNDKEDYDEPDELNNFV